MSRLKLFEPHESSPESRRLLAEVERQLGAAPNFMKALAASPSALGGFLALHGSLGRGALGIRTSERIALAMAESNACQYCVSAHTALARKAGLGPSEIEAARRGGSEDPKEDAAVRFARAVLGNKGDVTTAEIEEVRSAGYGDAEIVEIIAHVALNTWTNFLGRAGRIDIDFPAVKLLEVAA